ncbi:unnamed protein product [Rangifer tarandus platyrhynchus]|uniref:Uncharacterized protein n=2 Tax=Rangifer tarandus platyrhynchus TaxID=3082113 RepID=A0ABN8YYW2_RANTA|nr:unnamed protein product [Rangifer tarandus platyrhynchus]CAI9693751.1 unnamed protein product [Rangifer tarandus platyrhynchus]
MSPQDHDSRWRVGVMDLPRGCSKGHGAGEGETWHLVTVGLHRVLGPRPGRRASRLTPVTAEYVPVITGLLQAKMRSVAWALRPDKSGDLDTERTQGDDNVKAREELTPDKSRNPEPPETGRGQSRLAFSNLRRTSLQTAGLGRWPPGCATTEPVVKRPQDTNSGGSGVMLSGWMVEEGGRAHLPPGGHSAPLLQEE